MKKVLGFTLLCLGTAWARTELEDRYSNPRFSPDHKQLAYERHFLSNLGRRDQV